MFPSGKPVLPLTVFHLKMDTLKAFEEENYPLSVVHIVTALESLIKIVLSYYYDSQKMEEINEYSVSKLIRANLPDVFSEDEMKKHRKQIFDAIQIRNDIIHRAKTDLTKEQTRQILKDCNEFVKMLLTKYSSIIDTGLATS